LSQKQRLNTSIGSETQRLISIFRHLLRRFPAPRSILDIGCGDCRDVPAYRDVLSDVPIVGIDQDRSALHLAHRHNVLAVEANIATLPLQSTFDLVLMRHPDLDRHRADWENVLHVVSRWQNSILLITTYSAAEMDQIQHMLPFLTMPDDLAPPGLAGRDRFAAIYYVPGM
jgi:SAM-dependent methyltransferase